MPQLPTAVLVIDAQQSFQRRPYWHGTDAPAFFNHMQMLVDGARAQNLPVVQVFHFEAEGAFSLASGYVKTLDELSIAPNAVVHKHRHGALVGSGLLVWLTERGICRLIISGIRTEQCCETTTRHASDCGYSVDFVTAATLTFPMSDRHGHRWSTEDIKARTGLVLDGRFARICSVEQELIGAAASQPAGG